MLESYIQALAKACEGLPPDIAHCVLAESEQRLLQSPHGDQSGWLAAVRELPDIPARASLATDTVSLSAAMQVPVDVASVLRRLCPWRKGPFDFFGVHVDTEWRSDWKWQRIAPHLDDLAGRRVLDVGCGSGYHCWRMRGAGASFVLGIDPTVLFLFQFLALKRYQWHEPVWLAPLRMEQLPAVSAFDTVFSMGVLYHRRSPLDHIQELMAVLRPGGQLVLETLVVEGDSETLLFPEDRYARMRNVFFLPSSLLLTRWCERLGLVDVRIVDESVTSTEEQRATDWMKFQSLADFLDPRNPALTLEGYPAPRRAVLTARLPA